MSEGFRRDIVAIGASAGGIEALKRVVARLDAALPSALFVVLHLPPGTSVLPRILERHGTLPAGHARDGEPISPGRIYVAPPDRHMLVKRGRLALTRGPTENRHRPAIDPLMRSTARAYGSRAVGVILSGNLDDGTHGLAILKNSGGLAVVQDPTDATFPGMPTSAIEHVHADHVLTADAIGDLLNELATGSEAAEMHVPEDEVDSAELDQASPHEEPPGAPSGLSCPDCGGSLWYTDDGHLPQFKCRVGHVYSMESMLDGQYEALESALWMAHRAMEERIALSRKLARSMRAGGREYSAERFEERAADTAAASDMIRQLLGRFDDVVREQPPDDPDIAW